MNIDKLVEDMKDDASAWQTVQREYARLRDLSAERKRLARMLEHTQTQEVEALNAVAVALTVIKNRQEGK